VGSRRSGGDNSQHKRTWSCQLCGALSVFLSVSLCLSAASSVFALHSCFLEQVGGSVSLSVMDYLPSSLYTPPQAAVWWPALNDALITAAVAKGAPARPPLLCTHRHTHARATHTEWQLVVPVDCVCVCVQVAPSECSSASGHTLMRASHPHWPRSKQRPALYALRPMRPRAFSSESQRLC
jgi:hypothetical protein